MISALKDAMVGGHLQVSVEQPLGSSGYAALWAGFAFASLGMAYFMRSLTQSHHSPRSMSIYALATAACMALASGYLIMATGFLSDSPFGAGFDFTWMQYVLWVFKTPCLLLIFGILSDMHTYEIALMVFYDYIMIGTGAAGQFAATSDGVWSNFSMGMFAQVLIFLQLINAMRRVNNQEDATPENRCFVVIFKWSFIFWNLVTLVMVLDKLGLISYDGKAIFYVITELMATLPVGFAAVGAMEAIEGEQTTAAGFSALFQGSRPAASALPTTDRRGSFAGAPSGQLMQQLQAMQQQQRATLKRSETGVTADSSAAEYVAANPALVLQIQQLLAQQQMQGGRTSTASY